MHTKLKSLLVATVIGAGLFGTSATAQAQSFKHIHGIVSKLERQMDVLHHEVDHHFKPFPQYVHLHKDIVAMERLARHIHELVDHGGSLHHLLADVKQLDREYHHVRSLVNQMSWSGKLNFQTRLHLNRALNAVGTTLHHLRHDLEWMDHDYHHHHGW